MPIHRLLPLTALAMLARSTSWKLPSSCGERIKRGDCSVWHWRSRSRMWISIFEKSKVLWKSHYTVHCIVSIHISLVQLQCPKIKLIIHKPLLWHNYCESCASGIFGDMPLQWCVYPSLSCWEGYGQFSSLGVKTDLCCWELYFHVVHYRLRADLEYKCTSRQAYQKSHRQVWWMSSTSCTCLNKLFTYFFILFLLSCSNFNIIRHLISDYGEYSLLTSTFI